MAEAAIRREKKEEEERKTQLQQQEQFRKSFNASRINAYFPKMMRTKAPDIPGVIIALPASKPERKRNQLSSGVEFGTAVKIKTPIIKPNVIGTMISCQNHAWISRSITIVEPDTNPKKIE